MSSTPIRLTKVQRDVLEALRDGGIIRIDRSNMAWLGDRSLSSQTRYFLTDKRLVERRDKGRSVESEGNGFVLSPKGLALLEELPAVKHGAQHKDTSIDILEPEPPTERQLAYARDLEISIPDHATKVELSELIEARLEGDSPAAPEVHAFAKRFGVIFTQYIGKKSLFDRLFMHLARPGREEDMTAWFVFRVYRQLFHGHKLPTITSPDDIVIRDIARMLAEEKAVIQSIRRYSGRDLVMFGAWTSPDGIDHYGGSKQTIAYKRVSELIRERVGFSL